MGHAGMLCADGVIQELFNWEDGVDGRSTFSRFFGKFAIGNVIASLDRAG